MRKRRRRKIFSFLPSFVPYFFLFFFSASSSLNKTHSLSFPFFLSLFSHHQIESNRHLMRIRLNHFLTFFLFLFSFPRKKEVDLKQKIPILGILQFLRRENEEKTEKREERNKIERKERKRRKKKDEIAL